MVFFSHVGVFSNVSRKQQNHSIPSKHRYILVENLSQAGAKKAKPQLAYLEGGHLETKIPTSEAVVVYKCI